jgi:plasmid stability protein
MPKQLTVRGVPDEVSRRLEELSQAKGKSVNATVVEVLEHALDVDERRRRLGRYATWSPAEQRAFEDGLATQRLIDANLWR